MKNFNVKNVAAPQDEAVQKCIGYSEMIHSDSDNVKRTILAIQDECQHGTTYLFSLGYAKGNEYVGNLIKFIDTVSELRNDFDNFMEFFDEYLIKIQNAGKKG